MRRLSKSEIRFRLASFSFFTLPDAGLKVSSDSGLNTVAFRSCISNGKPEELLYLMFGFFISNFMKSITVYAASLCTFVRFDRAVVTLQNKTRQVSSTEGASLWRGLGACPPENFET